MKYIILSTNSRSDLFGGVIQKNKIQNSIRENMIKAIYKSIKIRSFVL